MFGSAFPSAYEVVWFFLLYAFIGWCAEVVFCSVNTGQFVNRGFLNGPLCPIYGFGAVAMVLLLEPLVDQLFFLYLGSALVCSLLELFGGWLLEKLFHTRWWDYSDVPFNIGGYICLKFSLLWGIAGIVLMRGVHPLLAKFVALIPQGLGLVLLALLYSGLVADVAITAMAAKKLDRDVAQIARLRQDLRKPSDAMAKTLGNAALDVAGRIDEMDLATRSDEAKQHFARSKQKAVETLASEKAKWIETREQWQEKATISADMKIRRGELERLLSQGGKIRQRLIKAFPDMRHTAHNDTLQQLRQRLAVKQRSTPATSESSALFEENLPEKKNPDL